jgi:chemotaxis protein MotB
VLTKKAQRSIEGEQGEAAGGAAGTPAVPDAAQPPAADDPVQPEQLRERLNIFEDGVLRLDQQGE